MKFGLQSQERRLDLTVLPMVNVVFLLLIFFMLVGRVGPKEEFQITPPVSQSGQLESGRPVRVEIDRGGVMALDGRIIDTTELIVFDYGPAQTGPLDTDPAQSGRQAWTRTG